MENKKQLIIIPPMSEALKKLHEVLEGITTDENMEVTLIDDLKELSQFLGTTGQCLILASNAKKCATFLQENRFMLAKHHCKTILLTPKEIPAKTLVKFTKIGLTESILESSPPKTFLYKVKLLLRSIKTVKPQDDADKLVKSLDINKPQTEEEKAVKEKSAIAEENIIDMERPNKKKHDESGEAIDYGNPLKGKIKPAEENLDTHWKSDRKKDQNYAEAEAPEDATALDSDQNNLDMYYRSKRKKTDAEPEAETPAELEKLMLEAQEEEIKKRKSGYVDAIDEGTMKQKRLDSPDFEEIETQARKKLAELEVEAAKKKEASRFDEESDLNLKSNKKTEMLTEEEPEKENDGFTEDLGGYLKGKLSKEVPQEEEQIETESKTYDNSELEDPEKEKYFDLDLEAGNKNKKRKDDIAPEEDNNTHDGEVDHLDGNMIGDSGTVDKIRSRMEGKSDYTEDLAPEEETSDFFAKRKKRTEEESENKNKDFDLELSPAEQAEKKKAATREEAELELRPKEEQLKVEAALTKARAKDQAQEEDKTDRNLADPLLKSNETKERQKSDKEEEEESGLRSTTPELNQKQGQENKVHNGQVDKIDTYYRSGEATAKKQHSWDNLLDKDSTLELEPGKTRRNDGSRAADGKGDQGEVTIDYRKLKEEFDMISRDGIAGDSGAIRSVGNNSLKNDDDDGSFKVVEIDPKSLDFSINIINSIYQKDIKAKQIFEMLTEELVNNYHCYPVFYSYKLSDKKFTETFNAFVEVKTERVPQEKKDWWNEFKKDTALFEHFQSHSMTTWRCPEIINNGVVWEDVELPSWADQELKNKHVELIFPYFDGIDRMGMALIFFPDGLNPKTANGLLTVLEMARSLYLDTIQRYQVRPAKEQELSEEELPKTEEKKNVLSFFGGFFGKKKAG